ncbi:hypothetical protein CALVIDRAFT_601376 [Calocera viscosa TUFC12733]|uniref:Low temperature requirement A n=1 Tax=Calocera viscosa (strain TUFC12733) TaxID=1330018 RepID=A0A167IE61_CALVF|nr:hypothetical protein CALVIDRAFT_601376 [Calocera viscosa TUFC12733]
MEKQVTRTSNISRETQKLEKPGPKPSSIPLVIYPGPIETEGKEDEEEWLREEQRGTEWLNLLYDLVIVAILTVFSASNEVSSPESILTYFSYIVLIWWVWASQTLYDVRFQANDWIHRLFKFLQLAAFAFVGITSQAFDPENVLPPSDDLLSDPTVAGAMQQGATAFKGVAAAYGLSRLLCGIQYLYVAYATRRHGRWVTLAIPAATCFLSFALNFIAAFLNSNTAAKIVLLYLPLGLEMLAVLILPFFRGYIKTPVALVSQRYGELTLVILGEGIIGIIRNLGNAVKGFGVGNNVYGQAVCVLVIVWCAWHFLFHGFNAEIRMGRKRGILWLILHLPLHFVLLLLLAGMNNAVQYDNLGVAFVSVTGAFDTLQQQGVDVLSRNGTFDLSQVPMQDLTLQFGNLELVPSFPDEVAYFENTVQQFPQNTTVNPFINLLQYEVNALMYVAVEYQLGITQELYDTAMRVTQFNASWVSTDNETVLEQYLDFVQDTVGDAVREFSSEMDTEILQGTVFFLPATGGFLFLVCVLNVLRAPPSRLWPWTAWGTKLAVSIGLGLLGLLDLGGIQINFTEQDNSFPDLNAVYRLLRANWLLPTAAITYAALVLADAIFMSIARWAEERGLGKVATEESYSPTATEGRAGDGLPLERIGSTKDADKAHDRESSDQDEERFWAEGPRAHSPRLLEGNEDGASDEVGEETFMHARAV